METVFVFQGISATFASAVFTTKELAEKWIEKNGLSGTITEMPVNISAYDHAIEMKLFIPKKPHETSPKFIANFSSRLWHEHYGPEWPS
jgi:hypothetical protein